MIRTKCCALLCVKDRKGGKLPRAETEKEEVRERELKREKDSVGAKIRTFSQTTNGNVI